MILLAHLKWFEAPGSAPTIYATPVQWLVVLGLMLGGLGVLYLIDSYTINLNQQVAKAARPAIPYVATIIALTIGLTLAIGAWRGAAFAPNILLTDAHALQFYLIVLLISLGILLTLGLFTRASAIGLAVVFGIGMIIFGPMELIEHLEYLGAAAYLIIVGSGRVSVDRVINRADKPLADYRPYALPALRILTGLSLAWLALSEKLLNIGLAEEFLGTYHWNFLHTFGINNVWFTVIMGGMELLFGVALVLGIAPRLVIASIAVTMVLTTILLGPAEVVGHLFAIGVLVAVWVETGQTKKVLLAA
jgi:uncharacterized membrane protein YphA (DoxX/SURF4 family)